MAVSPIKYTGVTKAGKGHGLRVDYKQDTFIMETARLISMVGTSNLSTKAEQESLRGYIQQIFSDYMETKFNKKGAKTSKGAAADLQMTNADAFDTFGVSDGITDAMRGIEIKSTLVSDTGTTITQVGAGTVEGQKRRFVVGSGWQGASASGDISLGQLGQQGITIADDTLSDFSEKDQEKINEITAFFGEFPGQLSGKQIIVQQQARKGNKPRTIETSLFLIPWNSDGTIDMQAISGKSIGNFVKNGKGAFAQSVRTQINQKMGEGVSFNFNYDALKKGGKSAARFAPKGALDLMTDYNYELRVRTEPRKNGYSTSFSIRPKLSSAGIKKFQDITVRFKDAPQKMMRDFMAYAIKRLRAQARGESDKAKKKYLTNYIGYFAQFSIGTLTPYLIDGKLEVPSAKELIVRGRGKLLNKAKISGRGRTKQTRGRFLSNAQLSAILQKRLIQIMPHYPEPIKPTPRYITGKLARSFQVMANYRIGLMGYLNTPPVAGYVDQLNRGGWELDKTLVEPTIRQITQQLFGRQFRVLRTQ